MREQACRLLPVLPVYFIPSNFSVIKGLIIVLIRRMLSFSNIEALNGQLNVCSIMRKMNTLLNQNISEIIAETAKSR